LDLSNLIDLVNLIYLKKEGDLMELPIWAIQFLAGGMGGLVRGLVGIISIIFDQFAGVVFKRMSLLAGYVYPVYAPL